MKYQTAVALILGLVLAPAPGCIHFLEPIRPPPLGIDEITAFEALVTLRLENAYTEPEIRRLIPGAIHRIDTDLRDWTGRLLSELRYELDRRGAVVIIPPEALEGTAAAPQPLTAKPSIRVDDSLKTLRVRVTEVVPPDPELRRSPRLSARVESPDGSFATDYSAGADKRGFSDTLLELKRRIVRDPKLGKWLGGAKEKN